MKAWLWSAVVLGGLGAFALTQGAPVTSAHAETDIEKTIEKFIKSNPKLIADTLDGYLMSKRLDDAHASVKDDPTIGPKDAKVVMIEFGDYRCGYCRRVQDTLAELREEYKDRVLFSYKAFPILSEESFSAALAVSAAHKQGKFWEYNGKVWDNQSRLSEDLYVELAEEVGLDMDAFNKDRESDALKEMIGASSELAQKNGGSGTPFFLINGKGVSGAQPVEAFKATLDDMLETYSAL
jgi:protein-disulfide isomerase